MKRKCALPGCEVEFEARGGGKTAQRYCCRSHKDRGNNGGTAFKLSSRKCALLGCEREFEPRVRSQKFCCEQHRQRARQRYGTPGYMEWYKRYIERPEYKEREKIRSKKRWQDPGSKEKQRAWRKIWEQSSKGKDWNRKRRSDPKYKALMVKAKAKYRAKRLELAWGAHWFLLVHAPEVFGL